MDQHKIPEPTEAELRVSTAQIYKMGGVQSVINCILAMQNCQRIILTKLEEILVEEGMK